jgi:pentapeptide repeat protein
MADDAQLARIKEGYIVWNAWRTENPDEVDLSQADLQGGNVIRANLANANLRGINLRGASARDTDFRGADFGQANFASSDLRGANLRSAIFNNDTDLSDVLIDNHTCLGDIQWNGVDLTGINWDKVHRLGDEDNQQIFPDIAVRAYRQVTIQLRAQGMNEIADRFAYRARLCRRRSLAKQRNIGAWLWSYFLDILAGYGYYPARVFRIYLSILLVFAAAYYVVAQTSPAHLSVLAALILSITSFHGRGFFPGVPGVTNLDNLLVALAAGEAILGLFIEASFIATFTDRYFGDR